MKTGLYFFLELNTETPNYMAHIPKRPVLRKSCPSSPKWCCHLCPKYIIVFESHSVDLPPFYCLGIKISEANFTPKAKAKRLKLGGAQKLQNISEAFKG